MRIKFFVLAVLAGFALSARAQTDVTDAANKPVPFPEKPTEDGGKPLNKVILDYEHDELNQDFSDWDLGSVSLGHRFSFGSVIARYNKARRFDTDGEQGEIDAYPHLWDGAYAYLNYGHSNSSIYPVDRYGGEIFQSLPQSFEASLGVRQLNFKNSNVTLWTASIAKYIGDYYIYIRPFYTPSDIGASSSWTLGARYYLDDEQYLAASVGQGLSVDQDASLNVVGLRSQKVTVEGYLSIAKNLFVGPYMGYRQEEIRSGVLRDMATFGTTLEKRF